MSADGFTPCKTESSRMYSYLQLLFVFTVKPVVLLLGHLDLQAAGAAELRAVDIGIIGRNFVDAAVASAGLVNGFK